MKSGLSSRENSQKRKPKYVLECILKVMTKMHEDTSDPLEDLVDLSTKRVEVNNLLADGDGARKL